MKFSLTTFFGLLSAGAQAVALVDGLPYWLTKTAQVVAAISTACFGKCAMDAGAKSGDTPKT